MHSQERLPGRLNTDRYLVAELVLDGSDLTLACGDNHVGVRVYGCNLSVNTLNHGLLLTILIGEKRNELLGAHGI